MSNKFIILSFAILLSFTAVAQNPFGNNDQEPGVSIYPNPVVDVLIVQIDGQLSKTQFELNSMIGNRVVIKPENVGNGKYKIPVKDLATGYYFLIIQDDEERFKKAFKFLKQ